MFSLIVFLSAFSLVDFSLVDFLFVDFSLVDFLFVDFSLVGVLFTFLVVVILPPYIILI